MWNRCVLVATITVLFVSVAVCPCALADGFYPAGTHQVAWDGTDSSGRRAARGVYYLRSVSGGETHTTKVMVIR